MIRRSYAYIVFAAGVALAAAGFTKVVPGGLPAGGALALLGLALFGLSFVPGREPRPDDPEPMWEGARLAGIFFEPSAVFRNLRAHPRWFVPVLLIALLGFAYSAAFSYRLTPERIASFTNDRMVERGWVPADQAERLKDRQVAEAKSPARFLTGPVTSFVAAFVMMCVVAGIFLLVVLMLGGRINFWQALAVAAYAALPVALVSRLISLVLLFVKDPDDIHPLRGQAGLLTDNLGALVSASESPVLYAVLSAFGVLSFYYLWLNATGLRHGGERVGSGAAWSAAVALWVIGLLLAAASSALFGSFIS
ncbi:MAG TPA: YIP1 family protein [Pyrinomonadaceae bacterium]|nr:YIP1 family protein [Pyrinomonadaceae bacterium]